MPNMMVNQTPGHVNETEGANVTIKCQFRRPANLSLMEVKWHKDGQEISSLNHSVQLSQEGTLMLMNANVEDSGNYVCAVRIRNRTGSGNGTHVHIRGREKPSQNANINADNRQPSQPHENIRSGIGIPVGVGVAVGTLVFLLLLGVVVWRSKRKGKGTSGNPSEVDPALTKEARKHTSLTNQVSNVTYADLRFHKREVQPDAEVVYAEVRGAKRPGHQDRATQPAGLH
ncbi:uncharacterized protein LOC134503819 isoform X2 [Candoia aspera]|uniref:uncharacterized protein LOC134503819 isoform X2 n=1 Tax=Candoia aspera TaxID=51853 RepID=UPI002FD81319